MISPLPTLLGLSLALLPLMGCSPDADGTQEPTPQPERVTGTLIFDATPSSFDGLYVTAQILDVTDGDASAPVISQWVGSDFSTLPIPYTLGYDADLLDTEKTYAVSAKVEEAVLEGDPILRYITGENFPVITQGAGHQADLLLETVE